MRWFIATLGLIVALSIPAMAQQQRQSKSLTNEDFPSGQRVNNSTDSKSVASDEESEKTEKEDEKSAKGDKSKDKEKDKKSEEWQKKYAESQQKTAELDRKKTSAELSAQELRNKLRSGGVDPQEFEQMSRQLREAEQQIKELNGQYGEAKKGLDAAKTEGDSKGYKEQKVEIPKTDKNGRANPEYYSKNYGNLSERQKDAQEKIQLYQLRINEARQRALQGRQVNPSQVGSAYYTDPEVKKLMEESQTELQKAQEEFQKTQEELDRLKRDAKNSGVSLN